ncbi:GIY-YIG nuclease family protein [Dokdonella sp.]|uniref:GIY-YIG nuclease family protein n=1 Tax=Dokdonella sp. TaxID=2291710 RepID=UPI0035271DC4
MYILHCSDSSYCTGHTDDLEARLDWHVTGRTQSCCTFSRRLLTGVFSQEFLTREDALAAERKIKGWSGSRKEAMIAGDWLEVSRLARARSGAE